MFRSREDAALQLAQKLKGRSLRQPLILAIPRGGVATGAVLVQELAAELDVVLSRKLHAPGQPELAIGAVGEDGRVYLNDYAREFEDLPHDYIAEETRQQLVEIERRKTLFRDVRRPAPIEGRSVIVTDDGIATGSTMIAALQTAKLQNPQEIIVAVPVVSPERMPEIRRWCDDLVYLLAPEEFWAIGQFYEDFSQIADDEVVALLQKANSLPQEKVRGPDQPHSRLLSSRHGRISPAKRPFTRDAHPQ
jgi:putative phosphoribosyl transferase